MNFYIIGIVVFILVIIVCGVLLLYYMKDEKKLAEVTSEKLMDLGKLYSKEEFEDKIFDVYANILSNIAYENYNFLKDAVSDEFYNQILLTAKKNRESKEENVIFGGRLAEYKYYDMDQVIESAFKLIEKELN